MMGLTIPRRTLLSMEDRKKSRREDTIVNGGHDCQWRTRLSLEDTIVNGGHDCHWRARLSMEDTIVNGGHERKNHIAGAATKSTEQWSRTSGPLLRGYVFLTPQNSSPISTAPETAHVNCCHDMIIRRAIEFRVSENGLEQQIFPANLSTGLPDKK